MTLTRRDVLAGSAALGVAPLVARATTTSPPDLDIAIVGGGVSGVYAAWRLAQEQPHLRVRLFEASERIGGRLHSVAFPQAPHLVAEAGGMRFLEAHAHVFGLVNRHWACHRAAIRSTSRANRMMLRGVNHSLAEIAAGRARFPFSRARCRSDAASELFRQRHRRNRAERDSHEAGRMAEAP